MVAVLFARADSVYKTLPGCDVWDEARDARRWTGGVPLVAQPRNRAEWVSNTSPISIQHIDRMARDLIAVADAYGRNVTISLQPMQPLAMGNYKYVVETWPKRELQKRQASEAKGGVA